MRSFQHPSFSYLSLLLIIGAMTTLVGCGGGGGETAHAAAATAGTAGDAGGADIGAGGTSATGAGGSSKGGSASGGSSGSSKGGSAGNDETGEDSGGSSGAKGGASSGGASNAGSSNAGSSNAGSSGSSGNAGSAGSGDLNGDFSVASFGRAEPTGPDHPLTNVETKLMRRDEVSLIGPNGSSTFGRLYDDPGHDYAESALENGSSLLADLEIKDTTSANLDDDGNDELVALGIANQKLSVRVLDPGTNGALETVEEFSLEGASFQHGWVRVSDFDQDGRDEILVAGVTTTGVVARLYDDRLAQYRLLAEPYAGAGTQIAAAVGNVDDDRDPELALLIDNGQKVELKVLDDLANGNQLLKTLTASETGLYRRPDLAVHGLRLEAGNFDDDPADELIAFADGYYSYNEDSGSAIYTSAIDDGTHGFALLKDLVHDYSRPEGSAYANSDAWPWQTLVADSDGDGHEELFVLALRNSDTLDWNVHHETFGEDGDDWADPSDVKIVAQEMHSGSTATMTRAAGRTDSRGADVIVAVHDESKVKTLRLTANSGAKYTLGTTELGAAATFTGPGKPVWATGGDFDGDSLRVRFTGKKWLELTRPRPIVVMAAPPVNAQIDQVRDGSSTAYGQANGSSSDSTTEYGYTDTVTLSFEVTVPVLDFISASTTAEMAEAFSETKTTMGGTTYATTYTGGWDQDVIIFGGTLCERFEYEVTGGSDQALIGTLMSIDVPVGQGTYKWSVEYYNQALGSQGGTIPADLLTHEVGDPSSYYAYDANEKPLPASTLWHSPKATPVGHTNGGFTTVGIEVEKSTTKGATSSTTYTAGGEGGAFVHVGYSHGWNSASSYSVTTGQSTTFQGTVGDIVDDTDYAQYHYSFGLFVVPAKLASGEEFQLLSYWTEGLGNGYGSDPDLKD